MSSLPDEDVSSPDENIILEDELKDDDKQNPNMKVNSVVGNNQKNPETVLESFQKCWKENKSEKDEDKLQDVLSELPTYGIVHQDKHTGYWYVRLSEEWQRESVRLAQLCQNKYKNHSWAKNGCKKAQLWYKLVSNHIKKGSTQQTNNLCLSHTQDPTIQWITPPATAGTFQKKKKILGVH
ncbi:hypothetical protein RFI_19284 [Reticulomyxa filosa]|uniref:Uncharacterized protein n=1 Tax=Reticulomyxa filosa TaxID=46433 RepID=X6MVJ6_RETFI|nr:hypothetical protein RFI_19284 [Reticulomyxa filosa]|eukprot:ETO18013.1 hypothetical protein RFI_19284 [Reticulomyxa filosa]